MKAFASFARVPRVAVAGTLTGLLAIAALGGCKPHSPLEPQVAGSGASGLATPPSIPASAPTPDDALPASVPADAPPAADGAPASDALPAPTAPAALPSPPATPDTRGATTPTKPRKVMIAEGMVALAAGQSAQIAPGTELRFDKVLSDSRCPAHAQCVWEGEVKIALTLSSPDGKASIELSQSTARKAAAQSFQIELTGYGPCAAARQSAGECASLHITPVELR